MSQMNRRIGESHNRRRIIFSVSPLLRLSVAALLLSGCTENKPTTRPTDWSQQAEADPSSFDPKMDDDSISGGSIGHFDKNAFNKDVDDVLSP